MANVYNMSSHNGNQDKLNEANAIKSKALSQQMVDFDEK